MHYPPHSHLFILFFLILLMSDLCLKDRLNIKCCITDCGGVAEHFKQNKPYCKRHFNDFFYLDVLMDAVGVGD